MTLARWATVGTLLGLLCLRPGPARASAALGHLQVPCTKGVVAVVDGRVRVRAQDDYGVIVRDLSPGPHRLVVKRDGFVAQHAMVTVRAGMVTVHHLAPWSPKRPPGPTGMLIIQTLPTATTIKANSLGWPTTPMRPAPLRVAVPVGKHDITVCTEYRCVVHNITVQPDRLYSLLFDLDRGSIEDLSQAHAHAWRVDAKSCTKSGDARACGEVCRWDMNLRPEAHSAACNRLWKNDG